MITLAKRGDLHARRQALAFIKDNTVTHMLFEKLKDRYLDRQGGYVRIIKKGNRKGDGAPISIIQLIPEDEAKGKDRKKSSPVRYAETAESKKKDTEAREEGPTVLKNDETERKISEVDSSPITEEGDRS